MSDEKPLAIRRLEDYLEGLEAGDYETAAAQFAERIEYHHPLLDEPITDRDDLVGFWTGRESREGADDTVHEYDRWVVDGDEFAALGHMSGPPGETLFISYGTLVDGKISLYVPGLRDSFW